MNRRGFLNTTGVIGLVGLAGCSGGKSEDGSTGSSTPGSGGGANSGVVVDETVFEGDIKRFNFDVEQGQTITIYIDNIEGPRTTVVLTDTEDEKVKSVKAETENTETHESSMTGVYAVNITTLGEAEVRVSLE